MVSAANEQVRVPGFDPSWRQIIFKKKYLFWFPFPVIPYLRAVVVARESVAVL